MTGPQQCGYKGWRVVAKIQLQVGNGEQNNGK